MNRNKEMEITVYALAKLKYDRDGRKTGRYMQDQHQRGADCKLKKNEEAADIGKNGKKLKK